VSQAQSVSLNPSLGCPRRLGLHVVYYTDHTGPPRFGCVLQLMNSERSISFFLAAFSYDVLLGNNSGDKASIHCNPDQHPDILHITRAPSLSCVGFSQGSAQAFAALSIHPQLNQDVIVSVTIAHAMRPRGLSAPLVDGAIMAS
jgi:lysosomal acid lipase/cholesteryl ester hydrolase